MIQHRSRFFNPIHSICGHCGHESAIVFPVGTQVPTILDPPSYLESYFQPVCFASLLFVLEIFRKPPPLCCQIHVPFIQIKNCHIQVMQKKILASWTLLCGFSCFFFPKGAMAAGGASVCWSQRVTFWSCKSCNHNLVVGFNPVEKH